MKVLLDHCVPRPLGRLLIGHETTTAYRAGLAALSNGDLLRAAAGRFDVALTVDQRIPSQQNPRALPLPVIVLVARDNAIESLSPLVPGVLRLLASPLEPRFHIVGA